MSDPPGSLLSGTRAVLSLAAPDPESLGALVARAHDPDVLEIRWDAVGEESADAAAAFLRAAGGRIPLLFTCRPAWQGGAFRGSEQVRHEILTAARQSGARWVDVELEADFAESWAAGHRHCTLLSHHWEGVPEAAELSARAAALERLRPAIGKLVAKVERPTQAIPMLATADRLRRAGIFPACFAMGEAGRASRLLAPAGSGGLLYVCRDDAGATAPGQWTLAAARQELRVGRWRPGQQLYGLIGDPIGHSLSPTVFNAAFAAAGRPAAYVPIPGSDADEVLDLAQAAGLLGLSVTMPFKEEVARRCVRLEGLAARVGAVNTLEWTPEGWVGHNTDGGAAVEALGAHLTLAGARVVIAGAGGAARSAAAALVAAGAEVLIVNRTAERAADIARELGCAWEPCERVAELRFDALVNATPVGMDSTARVPVSTAGLSGAEVVLEMIYRPPETELLRRARKAGCTLVPGIEMFVRQAETQHRIWLGEPPPAGSLRKAAAQRLEADWLG